MTKTFAERCHIAQQFLPDAQYKDMLTALHTEMLAKLAEQPAPAAQEEPVAEVKAKMTGGNVGIATVIHEVYSPLRESLQPGDKLYSAYRWSGWDFEQVWGERIFGIDMRFENVQDAIAFRKKLDEATTPQAQRKPLTEFEFEVLHRKAKGFVQTGLMDVVRLVENHHNIKENNA